MIFVISSTRPRRRHRPKNKKNWQQSNTRNNVNLGKLEMHWHAGWKSMWSIEKQSDTNTLTHTHQNAQLLRTQNVLLLFLASTLISSGTYSNSNSFVHEILVGWLPSTKCAIIIHLAFYRLPRVCLVSSCIFFSLPLLSHLVSLITLKWWNDIGLKRSLISFRRSKTVRFKVQ